MAQYATMDKLNNLKEKPIHKDSFNLGFKNWFPAISYSFSPSIIGNISPPIIFGLALCFIAMLWFGEWKFFFGPLTVYGIFYIYVALFREDIAKDSYSITEQKKLDLLYSDKKSGFLGDNVEDVIPVQPKEYSVSAKARIVKQKTLKLKRRNV